MLKKPTSRIVGAASKAKTPTPSASHKLRPALPFSSPHHYRFSGKFLKLSFPEKS